MGVAAALDLQHRPGVYGRSAGASKVPGSNPPRRGGKGEAKEEMGQETHHA